ncbi:MAG: hypothetical protein V3S64_10100 [bacterium]
MTIARWTATLALLWGISGAMATLSAQPRVVTQKVWAEAPILEDNFSEARSKAVTLGQHYLLLAMMKKMVGKRWIDFYKKEILKRILKRKNRYIQSLVVDKENSSPDRTKYQVVLSVRINRGQLTKDLRRFPLPLKKDKLVSITVFYPRSDPVLSSYQIRSEMLKNLRFQLYHLRYKLKKSVALDPEAAATLTDTGSLTQDIKSQLAGHQTDAALVLFFETLPPPETEDPDAPGGKGRGILYRMRDGVLLGQMEFDTPRLRFKPPGRNSRQRRSVLYAWGIPFIKMMEPLNIRPMGPDLVEKTPLKMKVAGLLSVEEQDAFERAFFQPESAFARMRLVGMSFRSVSYAGPFGENRAKLRRRLRGKRVGDFVVRSVNWDEDVLEIEVIRRRKPRPLKMRYFPARRRSSDVQAVIEKYIKKTPKPDLEDPKFAEREDNAWQTRANIIPLNATFYGFLDSRSDRDMFVANGLNPGEVVTLFWERISRTLLTPTIRLYDGDGELVKTYYPRIAFRQTYQLPPGQRRFFVEISDRFGPIPVDTGGYLKFHYLFKAEREKIKTKKRKRKRRRKKRR